MVWKPAEAERPFRLRLGLPGALEKQAKTLRIESPKPSSKRPRKRPWSVEEAEEAAVEVVEEALELAEELVAEAVEAATEIELEASIVAESTSEDNANRSAASSGGSGPKRRSRLLTTPQRTCIGCHRVAPASEPLDLCATTAAVF